MNNTKPEGMSLPDWVQQHLEIAQQSAHLNAFVHLFKDEALVAAQNIEKAIAHGKKPGKLYGVIISVKDNICIADRPVSAASAILKGYVSPFSATAVERLVAEDAIIMGTTNCDEFGMGSASTHTIYGAVRNADDADKVAGGSSGGAAVSVQIGACHLAIGTDTGGSIRQPAAFCGLAGFKPGYGKISRHGLIAYASSFDQLGFIARDTSLIRLAYDICRGTDEFDSTVTSAAEAAEIPVSTARLATLSDFFPASNVFTQQCFRLIHELGKHFNLTTTSFTGLDYLVPTYYILTTAEASSNLSRYDGVRYGLRVDEEGSLDTMYTQTRTRGFGAEVKKRIMLGTFVLSEGYYDAYYTKAQKVRRWVRNQLETLFQESDFVLLPVTASGPWPIDYKANDPLEVYYSDVYTVLASLAGLPAISIPVDFENEKVHLQIIGKPNNEHNLLTISEKIISLSLK
ncbi:MAG: Asp-tRNA(Asn)/Glu-tRNA(Gln) amidotransferase subunit GatA [Saprospiraceae bacterium]|nr:Asp-tRNA(Asn)/Glu-tRNA(Gln) amidotransferase subunit GatA [Saprospiraceae bacterium]